MDDVTLATLCTWTEARDQIFEGQCAVAAVIADRTTERYFSDGTTQGTVIGYQRASDGRLIDDQFSGFWFDMVNGRYTRVCSTLAQALARADSLLAQAQGHAGWASCAQAVAEVVSGQWTFTPGPQFTAFLAARPRALMYANLSISDPPWAVAQNRVAVIGAHTFFRA